LLLLLLLLLLGIIIIIIATIYMVNKDSQKESWCLFRWQSDECQNGRYRRKITAS